MTGNLAQGDILRPNERLIAALKQVHAWFADPKYWGFIVISQTCDLVWRDGECKAPHVEIAVIRPLRPYVLSLLKKYCNWIGDRYFLNQKNKAVQFMERLINQNEAGLGLFYLHPEQAIGIGEESIAVLRVSIALRSQDHYDTLLSARSGRLDTEFANKLGWLCGNLYSRIDVKDWTESEELRSTAQSIVNRILDDESNGPKFVECPRKFEDAIKNGTINLQDATPDEIEAEIKRHSRKPFKDLALETVVQKLTAQGIDDRVIEKVRQNLNYDSDFTRAVRPGGE